MRTRPPRLHVCFGTPPGHLTRLKELAEHESERAWWTINKEASRGDAIVFYLKGPVSAFVATGAVASEPRLITDRRNEFFGHYRVYVERSDYSVLRYRSGTQGNVSHPGNG
jgi:hypothetical protein